MYFLVMLLKKDYTVVYENVEKETTWVLSKTESRRIQRKINIEDIPELNSRNTVHLFDAAVGLNSYEIRRVDNGAHQIVFSSSNNNSSYEQFKKSRCYVAGFPSTNEDEFMEYVNLFKLQPAIVDRVIELCGYSKIRPLTGIVSYEQEVHNAITAFNPRDIRHYVSYNNNLSSSQTDPTVLLRAIVGKELQPDEQSIQELNLAYRATYTQWDLCSNYIATMVLKNYRQEADDIVTWLYQALEDDCNLNIEPFVGRLIKIQAPYYTSKLGLKCEPMSSETGAFEIISQG